MGTPVNGTPTEEKGDTFNSPSDIPRSTAAPRRGYGIADGMRVAHGIAIPHGMLSPTDEGYRTPTGEDYERNRMGRAYMRDSPLRIGVNSPKTHSNGYMTPRKSFARGLNLNHLSDKLDRKLSWKVRIRYFTWAAFAMNMATGGVANVLYNGKEVLSSPRRRD